MNRIAEIRRARGLMQSELAKQLGVTPQAISCYEQEKKEPRLKTLIKLSQALDCSLDELLGLRKIDRKVIYSIMLDDGRVVNTPDRPDLWKDDDDFFEINACTMPAPGEQRRYTRMWISKAHIMTVNNHDWRADDDPA